MLMKTRDIKDLAYWLSTTSTLLNLLQSTIKATSSPYKSPQRNRVSPATLSGRMAKVRSLMCHLHEQTFISSSIILNMVNRTSLPLLWPWVPQESIMEWRKSEVPNQKQRPSIMRFCLRNI